MSYTLPARPMNRVATLSRAILPIVMTTRAGIEQAVTAPTPQRDEFNIGDEYNISNRNRNGRYRIKNIYRKSDGSPVEVQFQQLGAKTGTPVKGKTFTVQVWEIVAENGYVKRLVSLDA